MILACLNCSARFLVSDDAIGARGRVVRCGRCDHVWFAPPPVRPAAELEGSAAPPDPEPPVAPADDDPISAPPLRDPGDLRTDGPPTRAQLPVLRRERRRWPLRLAWAVAVTMLIGAAAAAAWRFSAEIAAYWPDAEPIYTAVGIDALPAGFGLDLTIESSNKTNREGTRVLSIAARIQNTTAHTRGVPLLRGALFDENERELRHWTIPPPVANLAPDQEVEFRTEVADPPEDAVRISIVFSESG